MIGHDGDDPFAKAPADAAERAEAEWLLARERDPGAPPPSPDVARAYARLEDLLATPVAATDDDRWQDAVLASARSGRGGAMPTPAARRSRARWLALGGAVAAAATVAILFAIRSPRPGSELVVSGIRTAPSRGRGDFIVGDHLVVAARPRGATELRIYQGARTVLLRCPGRAECPVDAPTWHVDVQVTAPVPHTVILVFGEVEAPPNATMDEFLAAGRAAHARIVVHPTIDVH